MPGSKFCFLPGGFQFGRKNSPSVLCVSQHEERPCILGEKLHRNVTMVSRGNAGRKPQLRGVPALSGQWQHPRRQQWSVSISCCGQQRWNGRKQKASSEVRGGLGCAQDRKLCFKQNLLRKSSPWKSLLGKILRLLRILCLGWWNSLLIQLKKSRRKFSQSIHNKSRKLWRTKNVSLGYWHWIFFSFQSPSGGLQPGACYGKAPCLFCCRKGGVTSLLLSGSRAVPWISEATEYLTTKASVLLSVLIPWALYQVQTRHPLHALLSMRQAKTEDVIVSTWIQVLILGKNMISNFKIEKN